MGLIVVALPLFFFLWIVVTFRFAISHTIELGLLFGLGHACYQMMKSEQTIGDMRTISIFVIVGLVLIGAYAWYASYQRSELENSQPVTMSKPPEIDQNAQRDSYCRSMGVRYGRGAAQSSRGLSVDPQDDIQIPAECQNLPATSSGIRQGMKR